MGSEKEIHKIGVFSSGGDSPGMNAAIRAVVRAAIYYGKQPVAIYRGYDGMIDGEFKEMTARDVSNIIQRGGTILKSMRSERFMKDEGMQQAADNLKKHDISALVAIGGDGTFRGASAFLEKHAIPTIGIPGTIDNDISGTDYTIGYDTATNTVIRAIDAIRDTASAHNRLFFIEVMGRDSGFIALRTGLAAGAETILIPEVETSTEDLIHKLEAGAKRGKSSSIIVVCEGGKSGGAMDIAARVKKKFDHYDTRVTVLGHIQRGGTPTCLDREIASRMGVAAVEGLLKGKKDAMVGIVNSEIVFTPFKELSRISEGVNIDLLRVNEILSI